MPQRIVPEAGRTKLTARDLKNERAIVTAEPKRVADRRSYISGFGLVRGIVEVAVGVWIVQINGRGYEALGDRLYAECRL